MGQRVPCLVFGVLAEEIEGVPEDEFNGNEFTGWLAEAVPVGDGGNLDEDEPAGFLVYRDCPGFECGSLGVQAPDCPVQELYSDYESEPAWVGLVVPFGEYTTVDLDDFVRNSLPELRQAWNALREVVARLGVPLPKGSLMLTSREIA